MLQVRLVRLEVLLLRSLLRMVLLMWLRSVLPLLLLLHHVRVLLVLRWCLLLLPRLPVTTLAVVLRRILTVLSMPVPLHEPMSLCAVRIGLRPREVVTRRTRASVLQIVSVRIAEPGTLLLLLPVLLLLLSLQSMSLSFLLPPESQLVRLSLHLGLLLVRLDNARVRVRLHQMVLLLSMAVVQQLLLLLLLLSLWFPHLQVWYRPGHKHHLIRHKRNPSPSTLLKRVQITHEVITG